MQISKICSKALAQPACFAVAGFLHGDECTAFGNFIQYDIWPVSKIKSQSMPVS